MTDILFLAHRIPYPPDRGDKIRSWNMLKHLATLGRVHLACFADDGADAALLAGLRVALGSSLGEAHVEVRRANKFAAAAQALQNGEPISLQLFNSDSMRAFVREVLSRQEIGTIFAFSGQMAQFVPKSCRQRFVMDFVDVDSAKFADYSDERGGAPPMRWVHRREAEKLFAFERSIAAWADVSLFVSEAEAELFRSRARLANADIRAIQNGIDLDFYDPAAGFPALSAEERGKGPLIVFTGQMDYRPNVDAVTVFATETLPLVRARVPDARFAIVGRNPAAAVTRLASESVTVTGAVEDVRSWLGAADAVVAPLRIARGIQNKVLEAMAMARPVVATSAAFTGIEAVAGQDIIVADSADEQAQSLIGLVEDKAAASSIGAAARRQMESAYRWEAKLAPLAEIVRGKACKAAA